MNTSFQAKAINYPTPMGALTQLYAGAMPEGAKLNGKVCTIAWHSLSVDTQRASFDVAYGCTRST